MAINHFMRITIGKKQDTRALFRQRATKIALWVLLLSEIPGTEISQKNKIGVSLLDYIEAVCVHGVSG